MSEFSDFFGRPSRPKVRLGDEPGASSTAYDDQYAPDPSSREAAIEAMVFEVQPHEWRQGGAMRYAGHTITWGEYVSRRHEMAEGITVEPVLNRDEMLQLLALKLGKWPKDCDDCERTEPGWGWRWYDVPPDCEFELCVDGALGDEWRITESDWQQACWDAGEARIERIAQSDASGDHYDEDSDGESALSKAMDEQMQAAAEKWARGDMEARSKYHREVKPGVWVDVYSVLVAFGVTNPADAHAIKKMLLPGKRGHKDAIQDRREAIKSLQRAIELEGEQ